MIYLSQNNAKIQKSSDYAILISLSNRNWNMLGLVDHLLQKVAIKNLFTAIVFHNDSIAKPTLAYIELEAI